MILKYIQKDIIEWDYVNWSEAIAFWHRKSSIHRGESKALELGARNGGLSLWLASLGCDVICSDINGPSEIARKLHRKYKLDSKITYTEMDATAIPYENTFDIIIFKSVLGGIGRNNQMELQIKTFNQIYKALKPGGELFFAENLIASPIHQFFRRRFVRWGSEWRYVSRKEIMDWTSNYSEIKLKSVGFLGAFGRNEWQRDLLGTLDRIFFNYTIPDSWKYIIIGVARK
jgi:SAM-dependent methyltransferase